MGFSLFISFLDGGPLYGLRIGLGILFHKCRVFLKNLMLDVEEGDRRLRLVLRIFLESAVRRKNLVEGSELLGRIWVREFNIAWPPAVLEIFLFVFLGLCWTNKWRWRHLSSFFSLFVLGLGLMASSFVVRIWFLVALLSCCTICLLFLLPMLIFVSVVACYLVERCRVE